MAQPKTQTNPNIEIDSIALDALFKRIAERGHKIRNQNQTANSENIVNALDSLVELGKAVELRNAEPQSQPQP